MEIITRQGQQSINATVSEIAMQTMKIMRSHVGKKNAIESKKFFKKVTNYYPDDFNPFQLYVINGLLASARGYLKRKTRCFIISKSIEGKLYYYIPTNEREFQPYENRTINQINSLESLKNRGKRSIKERWYALDWQKDYLQIEDITAIEMKKNG